MPLGCRCPSFGASPPRNVHSSSLQQEQALAGCTPYGSGEESSTNAVVVSNGKAMGNGGEVRDMHDAELQMQVTKTRPALIKRQEPPSRTRGPKCLFSRISVIPYHTIPYNYNTIHTYISPSSSCIACMLPTALRCAALHGRARTKHKLGLLDISPALLPASRP